MIYIIVSITCIICILLGFWMGKGCPIPTKNTSNIPIVEPIKLTDAEIKKQEDEARQWENLFNYSGVIEKEGRV